MPIPIRTKRARGVRKTRSNPVRLGVDCRTHDAVSLALGEPGQMNTFVSSDASGGGVLAKHEDGSNDPSAGSSNFERQVREVVFLSGPSVLLVNFDGASLVHFESVFRVSVYRLGGVHVDIFNLGSARTQLAEVYGTAPTVVLLRVPHPMRDPRGFSWALRALRQLSTRRTTQVVPVIREREQPAAFFRSIARTCPYYLSMSGDYGEHCRLLTVLLETIG